MKNKEQDNDTQERKRSSSFTVVQAFSTLASANMVYVHCRVEN